MAPLRVVAFAVLLASCNAEVELYPIPADYTDELLPRAQLGPDSSGPPLTQLGSDDGNTGVFYSAALGGYFMARVQQSDGSFKYEYEPSSDEWKWQDVIHRQVGPAYAQALLYRYTAREEFRRSAEWAVDYARPRVEERDGVLELADIGGTSIYLFALTQLARSTGSTEWDELIAGLAERLVRDVEGDGRISSGGFLAKGQVLQALVLLFHYADDPGYLDLAERVGRYYWAHYEELAFDDMPYYALYASEALTDLYIQRPQPWILDYVFTMADALLDDQYTPDNTDESSWSGGFYRLSDKRPTWSATLRAESICDAYRLAEHVGDQERAAVYRERILLSVAYQQRFQWRAGETDHFPNPAEPVGGYSYVMTADLMRTDLAWHSTAMLLKAAFYLQLESSPGLVH